MTLNWESSIHFQPSALTAMGMVKGMTRSARTTFRPRNRCMSRNARVVPRTLLAMPAPSVKTRELRSATRNVELSTAASRLSIPTKRAIGAPTLASLSAR